MSGQILFEKLSSHIGQLTISQPERRNALTQAMWKDLPKVLEAAQEDKDLRVVIVTGAGEHFSAGADISEFGTLYATEQSAKAASETIEQGLNALADFPLPTVAMIRGACVGGGCALALACDMRFADSLSRFAITPVKLGLIYPFEDITRLIETVGVSHAKDMLFSARTLKAKHARKIGLINQLYKVDNLSPRVMDYAALIAARSPNSLAVMKQMMKAYQTGQRESSEQTAEWFLQGFGSDDFKKGYQAFLEKRPPEY